VQVVKGVMYLLEDDSKVGAMLFIHVTGRTYEDGCAGSEGCDVPAGG